MEKRGFSRTYAREVIEAGLVLVNGSAATRPGSLAFTDDIEVLAADMPYVSRGGYKLAGALETFGINVNGLVCLDVGASTGGFTDCMLKAGARMVYAVDAGRGQMADALLDDPRVVRFEGVDVRGLALPAPVDFVSCDVSFISACKVIPSINLLLKPGGGFVCLIKPQFETEGRYLNKKGIVKNKSARESAVNTVHEALRGSGFFIKNTMESPVTGGDGNIEYLTYSIKVDDRYDAK